MTDKNTLIAYSASVESQDGFSWDSCYFWCAPEEELILRIKYKEDIEKLYPKVLELSKE